MNTEYNSIVPPSTTQYYKNVHNIYHRVLQQTVDNETRQFFLLKKLKNITMMCVDLCAREYDGGVHCIGDDQWADGGEWAANGYRGHRSKRNKLCSEELEEYNMYVYLTIYIYIYSR